MIGPTRLSDCYDGAREGLVDGGTESIWYFGQGIRLMMCPGHLPQTSTTPKNFVR